MRNIRPVLLSLFFIFLLSCQQEQGNYTTVNQDGRFIFGIWNAPTKKIASDVIPVVLDRIRINSTNYTLNKKSENNPNKENQESNKNSRFILNDQPLKYITTAAPETLLPKDGDTKDWVHSGIPSTYNSETLYNDRFVSPEIYHNYGFQRQAEVEYLSAKHRSIPLILVEIFDMGSPENAFGIYSVFSYSHQDFEWIGCKALISPKYVRFWKGKYFIQIEGYEIATPIKNGMIDLAKVIVNSIKDVPQEIPLFKLLPLPLIKGSEEYFSNNWTLHYIDKALPKIIPELTSGSIGISAKYYDKENKKSLNPYTIFLFNYPNESDAKSAYMDYRNNLQTEKVRAIESNNSSITISE
ncbi:hypothetical protein JT359_13870 [Candidatus Poribacteria bacterium]|nr:hypothetical protein [Candidatus Poribacteria bacterium]